MEARGRGAGWIAHHFLPRSKKSSSQENIKIPISKRFHAPMRSGSWWRLLPEPFLQSFSIFLLAWSPSPRGWSIPSQWDTLPVDKDPVGLGLASTDRPTPYTPLQLLLSKLDILNIQTAGVLSAFYKLPSSEFATLNKDPHCDDLVSSREIAIRSLRLLETLGACDETGHSHKRSQLANPPWGDHLHCFDVQCTFTFDFPPDRISTSHRWEYPRAWSLVWTAGFRSTPILFAWSTHSLSMTEEGDPPRSKDCGPSWSSVQITGIRFVFSGADETPVGEWKQFQRVGTSFCFSILASN